MGHDIHSPRLRLSPHGHYVWIDAVRGIAALAVVVFHYHHFYLADALARPGLPETSSFPWAALFDPLYRHGHYAVELFWVISGFVFAHVYLPRPTTARNFAAARLARLYPLHLATLLLVAGVQMFSLNRLGHWQIYANNDLPHFLMNLGMASHWTYLTPGLSFNGPIWSVSLELLSYGLFFLSLGLLRRGGAGFAAALTAACFGIYASGLSLPPLRLTDIFLCATLFFTGTTLYFLHGLAETRRAWDGVTLAGLAGLSMLALMAGRDDVALIGICAAIVLVTAMLDRLFPRVPAVFRMLGDTSYSIYLVHVPMQMIVLTAADLFFGGSRAFATHPLTLPVYVLAALGLAWVVHVRFERPVGRALRRWMERR
ncbi:O-acyltransferase (plasmid) [Rhodovulum sp. P5]|nr:O-acyltransferase [Rhodovulum sp. P5]